MKRLLIAWLAFVPAWTAAAAQENDDFRVRIGLGAQLQPEYYGSDETELGPYWGLDFARGDNEFRFEAPDDGFDIALISEDKFEAGPVANIQRGRKNGDVGAAVGKIKTTIEAGAFVQFHPVDSLRIRGELRKGIGGHKGLVGDVGADYVWRDGDNYVFSIGPRILFSDAKFQRAFFGVSPAVALATGLPAYDPDGGMHAVAATSGLIYQFNPGIGMFGYARYERLVGDAAKSPIIRELGSRNQASAGVGLTYTFTVKR